MGYGYKSDLEVFTCNLNSNLLCEYLVENVAPDWPGPEYRLVLDHSSNQDANIVNETLLNHGMMRVDGPTHDPWGRETQGFAVKFPEGNIIENVWGWMAMSVHLKGVRFTDQQSFERAVRAAWDAVPQEYIDAMVLGYHRRLRECVEAEGGPIKY